MENRISAGDTIRTKKAKTLLLLLVIRMRLFIFSDVSRQPRVHYIEELHRISFAVSHFYRKAHRKRVIE